MEHAKKLLLTDPTRRSITDKKLTKLDETITEILNSDLSDDEKAKRYAEAIKGHRVYMAPKQ